MKLGTETGSLINHLMANSSSPEPKVGMGVTLLYWTDRAPGTIVWVKGNRIGVQEDHARRVDDNGMSECQEWEYNPNPQAPIEIYTRRKNGRWIKQHARSTRPGLLIGRREKYNDFSF